MRTIYSHIRFYCRVSSDAQGKEGTSLEAQRDEGLRLAILIGLPPPTFYVEIESGSAEKIERRIEQLRLIREIRTGELAGAAAVDRWSRDIVHAVQSVRALVKRGVGFLSTREGIDASTANGDSMLGIMAWAADQERRRIRDRTVGRRRELADMGLYVAARPPLGFVRTADRKLMIVEEEAALVRAVFARRAAGESLSEIAAALPTARGHTAWNVSSVERLLKCRYLRGEQRKGDGSWLIGAHPVIISGDLWECAQEAARTLVRGGRKFAKGISAVRLLRGLVWCSACGRRVSVRFGSRKQRLDPAGRMVQYYVCRGGLGHACEEGWVRAHELDVQATELTVAHLCALRTLLSSPPPVEPAGLSTLPDVVAQLARLDSRRAAAVDLATSGAMSADDLRAALARLDAAAERLRREEERAASTKAAEERARDPARRVVVLGEVGALEAAWGGLVPEQRREVLARLACRVTVGRAGVMIVWRTPEELVATQP